MLFTVAHQASELWLKLAVAETKQAIFHLEQEEYLPACRYLVRARDYLQYTTAQLSMLEKMTPWDYQHVRLALGHGSGFDSPGFRNLRVQLNRLTSEVQLMLKSKDLTLESLYLNVKDYEEMYALTELVVDIDESLMLWRSVHIKVIERTIGGTVEGTQGTPVEVVRNLRDRSIMNELWRVRAELTDRANRELVVDG